MIDGSMQAFPLTLNTFLEHAAKWHPRAGIATACDDGTITRLGYAQVYRRARLVSAMLRDLGVTQGTRVATLAWNSQCHVEAWYAVMGMGAVCHTLNPRVSVPQLVSMLQQSEASILIVSADLLPMACEIADACPPLADIIVIDGAPDRTHPVARINAMETLLAGPLDGEVVWGDFPETSPSGLCFTSGSTGAPKGVMYTHRSGFMHTMRLLQADMAGLRASDSVLPVVPMFHANAWGFPFAAPAVGARLVLPGRRMDGASLARLIASEEVTIAIGVPTVWLGLCEHVEATGGSLPSLERITVGGAPIAPALVERISRVLDVRVQTSWGMTELSPCGVFGPMGDPMRDPVRTSEISGRPLIGIDLMVADEHGTPLPEQRNHEGHLHVRGAAVIERYFGSDQPACDAQGWFNTGDLAQIDDDGNLTITGRAKDLIKSGGEWINPAEIESVIGALPEVALAAVIGRTHVKWGERPVLLVEMRNHGISDQEILAALNGRVASWWIPETIIRIPAMPLASTGKIDKPSLRTRYGAL